MTQLFILLLSLNFCFHLALCEGSPSSPGSSPFIHFEIQRHNPDVYLFDVLFNQQTTATTTLSESPFQSGTSDRTSQSQLNQRKINRGKVEEAVRIASHKRGSQLLQSLRIHSAASAASKQRSDSQQLSNNDTPNSPPKLHNHGNFTDFSLFTSFGNAYMLNLYVGSENTEFKVMLDTGSSYTWVTNVNCTTCESLGITKHFFCDKSTTCANQTQTVTVQYGKGQVEATVFRDQMGFNHDTLVAKNQDFLLATNITELTYFPGQGLLGLGFDSLSDGRKTIFDNLKEQASISKRQFAFSLSGDAEAIEFGQTNKDFFIIGGDGVDPNLADDSDSFTCDVSFKPYWSVNVTSIIPIISDVEMNIGLQTEIAIIDSGTSFIVFNESDFDVLSKFIAKLSKLQCAIDERYHLFRCQQLAKEVFPILKFTLCLHSRPILLYPQQYLICDETACYIRIASINFGLFMRPLVILGDIFMRTQYVLFSQDDMNISFYEKKTPPQGSPALRVPQRHAMKNLNTPVKQLNFNEEIEDLYAYIDNFKKQHHIHT